jgi:3'(2'), 5'-bisphosphate nucleotidase
MSKEKIDYDKFNQFLKTTICRAGSKIMEYYGEDFNVSYKKDDSPVTLADQEAEKIILKDLKTLSPHIPIIAEESSAVGHIPDVDDIFWLVDPLDGTKSFISKNDEFTVNIALIENGNPTLGLIYAPALKTLYSTPSPSLATRQEMTDHIKFGKEEIISVRQKNIQKLTAVASKAHRDEQTDAFLKERNITDIKSVGSSLKLCMIAEGVADIYPRFGPTMEWDIAAGHAILNAAGGKIIHPNGDVFGYKKKGFFNGAFIASS